MSTFVQYAKGQLIDINEIKEIRIFYPVCPVNFLDKGQRNKKEFILNQSQTIRLEEDLLSDRRDLIIITSKNRLIQHSYFKGQITELSEFINKINEHATVITAPDNFDEYIFKLSASFNKKIYVIEESEGNKKKSTKITYTEINITTDLSGTIKAVCKSINLGSGLFSNIWKFITSLFSKDIEEIVEDTED